jgi:putative ABC transport system substrate-binding protein
MYAKLLELLKEIAPGVTRGTMLRDPTSPSGIGTFAAMQGVAPSLRVELSSVDSRDATEIEHGIAACARAQRRTP